jgi:DMSO/TMAO reductase YedYZ molybdopterin-dependent catalytic subunit
VTVSSKPRTAAGQAQPRSLTWYGVTTGLVTAGVALGAGQLVAGFTGPEGSPVVAVGGAAIDLAPAPLKNFAISAFGSNDKPVLVAGILVVLALFAAAIGVAAMRRLAYGLAGLVVFAAIGLTATLTRPASGSDGVLPVLVGAAAGALTMRLLAQRAGASTALRPTEAPASGVTGPDRRVAGPDPGGAAPPAPEWAPSAPERAPSAPDRPPSAGRGEHPRTGEPAGRPGTGQAGTLVPGTGFPDRRRFLVAGSTAVAAAGASALVGRALGERTSVAQARSSLRLPTSAPLPPLPAGNDFRIPGLSPFVTPNDKFYRVDTALILPEVAPASWQLRIHGMTQHELTLSFSEILKMPLHEEYITLTCVSNEVGGEYISNARWLGTSLTRLLRAAGIRSGADQLLCTSVDGFTCGVPVQTVMDGRDSMLAVGMNGQPLPVAHGFPVRMVVPGLYGYVSATKWVTDIKVTTFAAEQAYWVQRGWAQEATIKTESRIDVPQPGASVKAGRVTVAGVAWAQHRGIDAVEVRVDGGPWQHARLASVPGIDTWRQWAWGWEAAPGAHLIEARATDATGYTQTGAQAPPEPNGATGYPSVSVSVR